jgi:hypothetical protein
MTQLPQPLFSTEWERLEYEAGKRIAADRNRLLEIEQKAMALVQKLDAINSNPSFQGIFPWAFAHGYRYDGPSFDSELEALRIAIGMVKVEHGS